MINMDIWTDLLCFRSARKMKDQSDTIYKSRVDDNVEYPAVSLGFEVIDDIWTGRLVSYMRGISVIRFYFQTYFNLFI
jgi:hypothetical protein